MSRKNRKRRNRGGGSNFKELFYLALAGAVGKILPPKGRMSTEQYCTYAARKIRQAIRAKMFKLKQVWVDPETPDDWESITTAILTMRMDTIEELEKATTNIDILADVGEQSAAGQQTMPTTGDLEELEGAQTWFENTSDWVDQTFSGNWSGGSESFSEGWNAFWTGNWF